MVKFLLSLKLAFDFITIAIGKQTLDHGEIGANHAECFVELGRLFLGPLLGVVELPVTIVGQVVVVLARFNDGAVVDGLDMLEFYKQTVGVKDDRAVLVDLSLGRSWLFFVDGLEEDEKKKR